ncbi:Glyoxalase/Bleomycin resistance protein/Dihydroxybiphenyl dioxygenase [Penicillium longicatenatum]|nr:Glyoxalase/Bleomycin resistance protein/Dihydroxybiphenyl dioxygenase [Penicillium longicatenatum]
MRIPSISNNPEKIQLDRLGHVYFGHPDLHKFSEFAKDFGFVEEKRTKDRIYYRGYGKDAYVYVASRSNDDKPRFRGPAFVARPQEEFDKATKLAGAMLTDDIFFHVIYGQEERLVDSQEPTATQDQQGPFNKPFDKPRLGQFQCHHPGPALVHKIGHLGYVVPDFDRELAWYTENFNFVPSDILHHWDFSNVDVLTFMHLDLGKEYSDHHVFFLQRAESHVKKTFVHHTSYEVADFDTQQIGHECGFKIEHYTDGDVVNEDTPMKRDVVGPFSVWGPEVPKDFGEKGV